MVSGASEPSTAKAAFARKMNVNSASAAMAAIGVDA